MANLPESSAFDAGVYQIETTDPVLGGVDGTTNKPLRNLANRTKYLKDHVDTLEGKVGALETTRAPLASPALTGTPTAPTPAAGTNTTQVATAAFVQAAVSPKLNTADIGNYAPTKTGGGASGTWNISISGNAASASAAPWTGVTGKPSQIIAHGGSVGASDWNGVVSAGVYSVGNASWSGSTNAPSGSYSFGNLLVASDNGTSVSQVYMPHQGGMAYRSKYNASDWQAWRYLIDSASIGDYAPTKTGGGASGTWNIHINGRGYPRRSDGADLNFIYSGQGGQPVWLWGTADGTNNQVYNPANFSVAFAARSARLMRRDDTSDFSLQHHWTGARWRLQGYAGDTFHAGAEVAYADLAGAVTDAGSSKAGHGYVKIPGSGLIIQWGRVGIGNPGQDLFGSIAFPIAFPNAIFQVNPTLYTFNGGAFDAVVGVTGHSLSGFDWTIQEWSNVDQGLDISYIAIGF